MAHFALIAVCAIFNLMAMVCRLNMHDILKWGLLHGLAARSKLGIGLAGTMAGGYKPPVAPAFIHIEALRTLGSANGKRCSEFSAALRAGK